MKFYKFGEKLLILDNFFNRLFVTSSLIGEEMTSIENIIFKYLLNM